MEALGKRLAEQIARGPGQEGTLTTSLRHAGTLDPERDAAALLASARHPDLAGALPHWAPALALSPDPAQAAHALSHLADAARDAGTPLRLAEAPLLARVVGASPFLARLLRHRPEWWTELRGELPDAPASPPQDSWDAVRAAKYRGLLRIVSRDLAGRPFHSSLYELSDLADRCLEAAPHPAAQEVGAPAPALLALGKLGGRELNFSSDVDVLFLEDPNAAEDARSAHEQASRVVRAFKRGLEERTPDGFGYRVDLDLRPEGRAGVLTNSPDAALAYYESFGAEWERQMLIRLRPLAGPPELAESFCTGVRPFVFRRSVGPEALAAVREMKGRIERERRAAGRDVDFDLKEGPGGIRDVEFLAQALQLFHGGRQPTLRSGNVLETLEGLGDLELLPADTVSALRESYLWLRRTEHTLQLAEEQQTARFPKDEAGQLRLARRMDYPEPHAEKAREALLSDRSRVLETVRHHFDDLVLGPET